MRLELRHFLCGLLALVVLGLAQAASAQPAVAYPSGAVRWIVPYPPGGAGDTVARAYAGRLKDALGQPVIVENRPGANTLIGFSALLEAPADGHTMLMIAPVVTTGHLLYPKAKWPSDPLAVMQPVSQLLRLANVMVVPASSPYRSIRDLLDHPKGKEPLLYGASSVGSPVHLAMEDFARRTGLPVRAVPYKGGPSMLPDLIGGQIGLAIENLFNVLPYIKSGKLRPLLVLSSQRSEVIPDVPSSADLGYEDLDWAGWQGVVVKAGTPSAIVEKLEAEFRRLSSEPELRKVAEAGGAIVVGGSAAAFTDLVRTDGLRQTALIRALGIQLD